MSLARPPRYSHRDRACDRDILDTAEACAIPVPEAGQGSDNPGGTVMIPKNWAAILTEETEEESAFLKVATAQVVVQPRIHLILSLGT